MEVQLETKATGKRLSKYRRIENAVPHVLTDRDTAIIAAVAEYRLLCRSQIQRLLGFGTVTRVNFRLQKLFHRGYLVRHFLPTLKGSSQAIYALDRLGLPVAAERLGKDVATLWRSQNKLSLFFLAHTLAVNDVRMAFTLAARTNDDHHLMLWMPAEKAKHRFFFSGTWYTLTPDAFLRYRIGRQILSAFLEVDRGTMPNRRFKEKTERYFAYDVSGRYAQRFNGQRFRVLVLARTPKRLRNLKQTAAQGAQRYCWFGTLSDLQTRGPFGAIWETVLLNSRVPLFAPDRQEADAVG